MLSKAQRDVLWGKATEPPFSGKLLHLTAMGDYSCAGCSSVLFHSSAKFDSGCGWPSFDRALPGAVAFTEDLSHGMMRTEVTCSACGGHLGHVFDDGPRDTTGQRFCVNSLALEFEADKDS